MKKNIYSFLSLLFFVPIAVFAYTPPLPDNDIFKTDQDESIFTSIVSGVVDFLSFLFLAGGVIMMLYAGSMFLNSGGEPEKITKARDNLVWGLVGLLVGLSAYIAPTIIQAFLEQ